jgi:KUP system potassium uptake protein
VLHFGSSTGLAAAYGLSVSGVMLTTSIAMTAIARLYWGWRWSLILLIFAPFGAIDAAFLSANSLKFLEGGYIPMTLGVVLFGVMNTWQWGRRATFAAYSGKHTMTVRDLLALKETAPLFDRNAILMVPKPLRSEDDNAPALLQLLWDRWGGLPKNLLFVEVVHRKVPFVHDARYAVNVFRRSAERGCVVSVTVAFGFMEDPNVERVLAGLAGHHEIDLPADPHRWTVHVSQENVIPARNASGFAKLRLRLFALLRQISTPAYYYYGLGNEVQLSVEVMPVRLS